MKLSQLLKEEKTHRLITKLLCTAVICTALLLIVEILFLIPAINALFSTDNLSKNMSDSKLVWSILWLLMFAQVTIIPIPALPIYVFCNRTTLVAQDSSILSLFSLDTLFFVVFVVSACLTGSFFAYLIGRFGGKKAVQWIAGDKEDYNKWSQALNGRLGKYVYALTVLLPVFPDDLLCIIAGALKIDLQFFLIVNTVGKLIGAYCLLFFLRVPYISSFFNGSATYGGVSWMLIIYAVLFLISLVLFIVFSSKEKQNKKS